MMDEPLKAFDNREKQVLRELEKQYEEMLAQLTEKVERMRQTATDMLLGSDDARMNAQSKIYQYEYQKALRDQISTALDQLRSNEFDTINDFLQYSYQNGYVGTMYDFAKDGVPLVTPIDQNAVIKAIQTDSKLQKPLYDSLGIDTAQLKKAIRQEVSRGLATNLTTDEIARNLSNASDVSLKRAKVIARTESHRIRETASFDAGMKAKDNGADIVKKWEATLDERTRETHRRLDGQFRELEDAFEIDGKTAMFPGSFGRPEEDCNCHCRARKIARWMLDDDELQYMHQRAAVWGLENDAEKVVQYREFEGRYLKASQQKTVVQFIPAKTTQEAEAFVSQFINTDTFGSVGISYAGVNINVANEINKGIASFFDTFDAPKLGGISAPAKNTKLGKMINAHAAYSPIRQSILLDRNKTKSASGMMESLMADKKAVESVLNHPERYNMNKLDKRVRSVIEASAVSGRALVPETIEEAIWHELGHHLERVISREEFSALKETMKTFGAGVSGYATDSVNEYVAESVASYMRGEEIKDKFLLSIFERLRA